MGQDGSNNTSVISWPLTVGVLRSMSQTALWLSCTIATISEVGPPFMAGPRDSWDKIITEALHQLGVLCVRIMKVKMHGAYSRCKKGPVSQRLLFLTCSNTFRFHTKLHWVWHVAVHNLITTVVCAACHVCMIHVPIEGSSRWKMLTPLSADREHTPRPSAAYVRHKGSRRVMLVDDSPRQ